MITYCSGNIFDSEAEALVNPVNTLGVAGKGLAKEFKEHYPESYEKYKDLCRGKIFKVGVPTGNVEKGRFIISVATKTDWREPSKMGYIIAGIKGIVSFIVNYKISCIAIPALGCGAGGLDWSLVKAQMEAGFMNVDCNFEIYEPK